ncbi:Craniofacial development protein 2 [Glycine soja]|uniref:Craniofacial development protein 2 n=1 Tax=Glycine soja TaxID=3848 RepID=A0A445F1B6_GLYSO|nr:Craniofacial development protein 2 [Glycine soja]
MDQLRNNVNARSLPESNALYGSSTVSKEQGPLHRRPDAVKSKQGFPHSRERVWVKKLVHDRRIRFGTWNIGTLTGKSMEIVDVMVRRKINFMFLQETKWTGEKAKELDNSGFKLWYTGKIRLRNGVGIIVDKEWKKDVVDVRRVGDRIIALKLVVGQDTFNVISGYAPQVGLAEHFKVKFWEDLEGVLQDIPQGEKVFLGGDLNGHVGSVARGFEGVHGGFGLGEMNGEGKSILEFLEALDLSIANTWFKKRAEHLITYKSGGTCSQIDFFLIRKSDRKYCLNCKVIPGESLTTQHRVLVMDVRIRDRAKRRSPMVAPRIKWWHLKGEKQGIFQQKIWEGWCGQSQGSANDMWNKMSQEIIKAAKETLGESRGFGPRGKESWWWNEIGTSCCLRGSPKLPLGTPSPLDHGLAAPPSRSTRKKRKGDHLSLLSSFLSLVIDYPPLVIDYQRPLLYISHKIHNWPATTSLLALWSLFLLSVDCQELACLGTSQVLTDRLCPGWVGIGQAWFWAIAPHLTSPRSPDPRDISPGTTLWSTIKAGSFTLQHFLISSL